MWSQVEDALNQSTATVVGSIARLLPGAIAFILAIVVSALLGWLLALGVRRALTSLQFDERMAAWGWSEPAGAERGRGPTYFVSRLAGGLVIFLGVLIGLSAFSPAITSALTLRVFGSAMDLITAALVLIIGVRVAAFVSRGVLISLVNMNVQQARLISLGVRWLIVIFTTAMALEHVQIGGRIVELAFGILFGGIVLTLALAVGLRSKDLAEWSLSQKPPDPPANAPRPLDHF